MKMKNTMMAVAVLLAATACAAPQADPLPSWNDGPTKASILNFVTSVTTAGSTRLRADR